MLQHAFKVNLQGSFLFLFLSLRQFLLCSAGGFALVSSLCQSPKCYDSKCISVAGTQVVQTALESWSFSCYFPSAGVVGLSHTGLQSCQFPEIFHFSKHQHLPVRQPKTGAQRSLLFMSHNIINIFSGVGEMAEWLEAPLCKPDNPYSVSQTHCERENNYSWKLSSDPTRPPNNRIHYSWKLSSDPHTTPQ